MFCSWAGKKWLTQMLSCLTMHQWPSKISIESYNQTNCTKVSLSGNLFVFLPMVVFVFVATEKKKMLFICNSFFIWQHWSFTLKAIFDRAGWLPFLIYKGNSALESLINLRQKSHHRNQCMHKAITLSDMSIQINQSSRNTTFLIHSPLPVGLTVSWCTLPWIPVAFMLLTLSAISAFK